MHAHNHVNTSIHGHGILREQILQNLNVCAENGLTEAQVASISTVSSQSKPRIYHSTMHDGYLTQDTFFECTNPRAGEDKYLFCLSFAVIIILWAVCFLLSSNIIFILIIIIHIFFCIIIGSSFNKSMEKLKNDINTYTFSKRNENRIVHVRRDFKHRKQFLVSGYVRNNILNDTSHSYSPTDILGLIAKFVCDEQACKKIHPDELLHGDIVMIRSGDQIYADMRIIQCSFVFGVDQMNVDMPVWHQCFPDTRYANKYAIICNENHDFDNTCKLGIDRCKLTQCPNFLFQGCVCMWGNAIAAVCQIDENTLLNKAIMNYIGQYGNNDMNLNDKYNLFLFHQDKTSKAISRFRRTFVGVNNMLGIFAWIHYVTSLGKHNHTHTHSISWNWGIETTTFCLILQIVLTIIGCLPLFDMRNILVKKLDILQTNNIVINSWNHQHRMALLDILAMVDVISMSIEELMIFNASNLKKFVNTCNELRIKLILFSDACNPNEYYHKMNLNTYGIVNGYTDLLVSADDILRKCSDATGIAIVSLSMDREQDIIKSICESDKTVCHIGNRTVLSLPWNWWELKKKFVSILVGNENANDIQRNNAHAICDLDPANGIMAVINTIQQMKHLHQRWYTKLQNTKYLQ